MPITTRNAKDWLEATLLDDDTMGGATPSDTDVVSQESIKVYTDNKVLDEDDFASDSTTQAPSQQSAAVYIANQVLDEDDFASDSATRPPSQQSTAVYIGTQISDNILDEDDFASDSATKAPSQQSTAVYIANQVLDEDDFATDSATRPPSQQSTKYYVDGKVLDEDDFATDSTTKAPSQQSTAVYIANQVLDEDDFATDSATRPPSQQSTKQYISNQILDEDDFASDSATKAPSQQSTKYYVDGKVLDEDDFATDSTTKAPSQQSAAAYIANQVLDEDDFSTDSATRPPSQQSTKVFVENSVSDGKLVFTSIDTTDTPYSASFGEVLMVADTTASVTVNLPEIAGNYGERIIIMNNDVGSYGVTVQSHASDTILGKSSWTIGTSVGGMMPLELISVTDGTNDLWMSLSTAGYLIAGDGASDRTYTEVMRVENSSTTGTLSFEQNLTGTADGFVFNSGADPMALCVRSATSSSYLLVHTADDASAIQAKLRHETANDEWRITSAGTNHDFFIRAFQSGSPQTTSYYADMATGNIGLAVGSASASTPIRISASLPVYADNAAAIAGSLVAGDVYRTSTGQLMVRY